MIPGWLLWAAAGLAISAAVAIPLRLENRRAHWEETAGVWKKTSKQWKTNFETQKQSYRAAQETARRLALADKERDLRNYRAIQERIDNADQELARYRARAERFARANSVRNQAGAARRDAGTADSASASNPAAGDNRPGDTAVVLERGDFDKLVDAAIRINAVHKWGNDLIAAGLATKAGE